MSARISISLVEDRADSRALFVRLLARQSDFSLLAQFADAESALAHLAATLATSAAFPAVILVDWHLGDGRMDGLEFIRRVKALFPQLRCLLITAHDLAHLPAEAIRCGADGFLYKSDPLSELPDRIRAALAGKPALSDHAAQQLFATLRAEGAASQTQDALLTTQEAQVLRQLALGQTAKEVAVATGLTEATVATYRKNAFKKLNVHKLQAALHKLQGGGGGGQKVVKPPSAT